MFCESFLYLKNSLRFNIMEKNFKTITYEAKIERDIESNEKHKIKTVEKRRKRNDVGKKVEKKTYVNEIDVVRTLQLGHLFRFHAMLGKSSCVSVRLCFFFLSSLSLFGSPLRVITVRTEAHFRQLNGFLGIIKTHLEHPKKCWPCTQNTQTH